MGGGGPRGGGSRAAASLAPAGGARDGLLDRSLADERGRTRGSPWTPRRSRACSRRNSARSETRRCRPPPRGRPRRGRFDADSTRASRRLQRRRRRRGRRLGRGRGLGDRARRRFRRGPPLPPLPRPRRWAKPRAGYLFSSTRRCSRRSARSSRTLGGAAAEAAAAAAAPDAEALEARAVADARAAAAAAEIAARGRSPRRPSQRARREAERRGSRVRAAATPAFARLCVYRPGACRRRRAIKRRFKERLEMFNAARRTRRSRVGRVEYRTVH